MMCVTLAGTCKCYIPAAAVIIVFILCYLILSASTAELKSPMRRLPILAVAGIIIEQL